MADRLRRWIHARAATRLAFATVLAVALPCIGAMQTTTTTYLYNADGAPTAVTTQIDAQTPTTVYLTWDNFVPGTANPTSGTVLAGNGNLSGLGPVPGTGYTTQLQYDQRNRLTNAATSGSPNTAYSYYPASLMASSTLASGDALQFYYDVSALPQVSNIAQPATAMWSSYLGDTTYLNDGTEQMLCRPRKDMAGVYQAAQQSFSPSRYDPYGAPASPTNGTVNSASYDMAQNPFQFAGEYRDATWGGYYLRARWYLPELQTFTARDPVDGVHRYSYAGGDPVGNVDPSGLSYGSFSRDINRAFRPLTHGTLGYIVPLVPIVGQIVGGMTLLANLPEVWHRPAGRTWLNFAFLTSSIASEAVGELPVFDRLAGSAAAFYGRTVLDQAVGAGQAVLSSYHSGKWDVPALVQSIEYNTGGIFAARDLAGFGYRPHSYTSGDVDALARAHFAGGDNKNDALVFKVRMRLGGTKWIPTLTSPLMETHSLGFYHEGVLAVGPNGYLLSDIAYRQFKTDEGKGVSAVSSALWNKKYINGAFGSAWEPSTIDVDRGFQYVGTFNKAHAETVLRGGEPGLYPTVAEQRSAVRSAGKPLPTGYSFFTNNCHDYAKRMIGRMQQ